MHELHWNQLYSKPTGINNIRNSWGCKIQRQRYDTKQPYGEVLVKLELWRTQITLLLPSPSGPFWPEVVAPDKDTIYELNWTKVRTCLIKLNSLK